MPKKMVLVPQHEYESLKKNRLPPILSHLEAPPEQDDSILKSNLPDDLKIKLYQEAKRIMVNQVNEMKNTPLLVKDVNGSSRVAPPPVPPVEPERNLPPMPPAPPMSTSYLDDFSVDDASMVPLPDEDDLEVEAFLKHYNVRPDSRGNTVIDGKTIEGSQFRSVVEQLSDGRRRRSPGTNAVMHYLRNQQWPDSIFSRAILQAVRNVKTPQMDITPKEKCESFKDFQRRKRCQIQQKQVQQKQLGPSEYENVESFTNNPKAKGLLELERKRKHFTTLRDIAPNKRTKGPFEFDIERKRKHPGFTRDENNSKKRRGDISFDLETKRKYEGEDASARKRARGDLSFGLETKRKYEGQDAYARKKRRGDLSFDIERKRKRPETGRDGFMNKKRRGETRIERKRKLDVNARFPQPRKKQKLQWERF